jgi:hypothetical protein
MSEDVGDAYQQQHLIPLYFSRNNEGRSEKRSELHFALRHDCGPLEWPTDDDRHRVTRINCHLPSDIPILALHKAEWGKSRNRKMRSRVPADRTIVQEARICSWLKELYLNQSHLAVALARSSSTQS